MSNTLLAVLTAIGALAGLAAGLASSGLLVGVAAVLIIVLLAILGARAPGRTSPFVISTLVAWGIAFIVLIALSYRLHDPSGPLVTIGGFPAATAMLVYGTVPVGIAMGVLYGLAFDRHILPTDRQRELLARFGKK